MTKNNSLARSTTLLPIAAGATTAIIWGFSFVFTKDVLNYTQPGQLLGLRFGTAALALTILKILGLVKIELQGKGWQTLLPLALCQPVIYFIGETWGIKWTTASEAGMIIALVPIFTAAAAGIALKEKIHPLQLAAIMVSVFGVIVIVSSQGKVQFGEHLWGILALFLAVAGAGAYNILAKKNSVRFSPVEITFVMMWMGTIFFNLMGICEGLHTGDLGQYFSPLSSGNVLIGILYLGLLSSVGGFFFNNFALSRLKVSQAAPLLNLTTVVSVMAGVLIQGDPFGWQQAIGITLIITGVWVNNIFAIKQ